MENEEKRIESLENAVIELIKAINQLCRDIYRMNGGVGYYNGGGATHMRGCCPNCGWTPAHWGSYPPGGSGACPPSCGCGGGTG